ncbi:hypothetical protein PR048_013866, partial [Dryococelus australis]
MPANGLAIPTFLQGTEPFENYVELLNLYFNVVDTKETDKVSVLGITKDSFKSKIGFRYVIRADKQLLTESEELKFAEAVKIVMDMDAVVKLAALMCGEKSGEVNVITEPACFWQLAIEDVLYIGAIEDVASVHLSGVVSPISRIGRRPFKKGHLCLRNKSSRMPAVVGS